MKHRMKHIKQTKKKRSCAYLDCISTNEFLDSGEQACLILLHFASTSHRRWLHFTVFPFGLGRVGLMAYARLLRSFTHSQLHHVPTSHRKI